MEARARRARAGRAARARACWDAILREEWGANEIKSVPLCDTRCAHHLSVVKYMKLNIKSTRQ